MVSGVAVAVEAPATLSLVRRGRWRSRTHRRHYRCRRAPYPSVATCALVPAMLGRSATDRLLRAGWSMTGRVAVVIVVDLPKRQEGARSTSRRQWSCRGWPEAAAGVGTVEAVVASRGAVAASVAGAKGSDPCANLSFMPRLVLAAAEGSAGQTWRTSCRRPYARNFASGTSSPCVTSPVLPSSPPPPPSPSPPPHPPSQLSRDPHQSVCRLPDGLTMGQSPF